MTVDSRLVRYREVHRIKPAWVFSDDLNQLVRVCSHCTIRVHQKARGYAHDAATIGQLSRGEDVERL